MKKKFYGNQFSTKKWRSFSDAKKFVHKLKLTDRDSWDKYARSGKKPDDIPAAPWHNTNTKVGMEWVIG